MLFLADVGIVGFSIFDCEDCHPNLTLGVIAAVQREGTPSLLLPAPLPSTGRSGAITFNSRSAR